MGRVAIIPARGGSRRVPHKNRKLFHGWPMLSYAIETAAWSELFDMVIVSTDDPEIAAVGYAHGASVWRRRRELCKDDVGTQEVIGHILRSPDLADAVFACCIYPCTPLMSAADLQTGFDILERSGFDYTYSVNADTWEDCGAWYWGKADSFRHGVPLTKPFAVPVGIDPYRALDINTPEDWAEAERRYLKLKEVA